MLGLRLFALYAVGACRTIYVGDSGELVAAVHTLGIPHPSGYPLYVLLGKLWTLLVPVGSIAFRMSLFSAACAAAAVGAPLRAGPPARARRVGRGHRGAAAGLRPSFWGEANVQRVYALNALFVVRGDWLPPLAGTATARRAAFCSPSSSAAWARRTTRSWPSSRSRSAIFAVVTRPALLRAAAPAGAAAPPSSPGCCRYLYLPIRSRMDPRSTGGTRRRLSGFLDVVLRRDFWSAAAGSRARPTSFRSVADYLWSLGSELFWVGAALALVGIVAGAPARLAGPAACCWSWPPTSSHGPARLAQRHLHLAPLLHSVLRDGGAARRRWAARRCVERLPPRRGGAPAALPLRRPGGCGFREFDRSRYRIAEDFSRTLLATLPPGAHLTASDDNILFVLIYLHLVEGVRPDVDLVLQGVGGADLPPLRFNPDSEPLFFTHHPNWRLPALDIVPVGLVFRALRAGSAAAARR